MSICWVVIVCGCRIVLCSTGSCRCLCGIAYDKIADSGCLTPTPETLTRFRFNLPEQITAHLNTDYNNGKTRDLLGAFGCDGVISARGIPLQAGAR